MRPQPQAAGQRLRHQLPDAPPLRRERRHSHLPPVEAPRPAGQRW